MRVAVVGGGITGSVAASELSKTSENNVEVVLFDQGRRGPGGRASHRSVIKRKADIDFKENKSCENEEFIVLPDDCIEKSAFQFDHGCQFFRTDTPQMKELAKNWVKQGWVAPWNARFGCLPSTSQDIENPCDFFGVPSPESDSDKGQVYIGVGGMHLLPRKILESFKVIVHKGTRVSGVASRTIEKSDDNDTGENRLVWDITTTVGAAAFHDTKESVAKSELEKAKKEEDDTPTTTPSSSASTTTRIVVHRGFDAVVFTDISSSSDSWHRASAGIPSSFADKLPPKLRLPLFSCMIALEKSIKSKLPYDAFVVDSDNCSPLWFAAVSESKPGFPSGDDSDTECWALISTPTFAVDEIRETTMRDPVTGAFRPQENGYLNSIPGPALRDAFFDLVRPYLDGADLPKTIYLQAQRWGSGLPIDPNMVAEENVHEICGTTYASKVTGSLVYSSSEKTKENFVADDSIGLYYGGDFCSHLNPGFEAAALSGLDLAKHILRQKKLADC